MIIVGIGYFVGAGWAWTKVDAGYNSLEAFSAAQNVELNYNDDGELVDRGTTEGAQAIMQLLEDDWNFPVVMGAGGLDPNDPVVNNQSEYMYQMATIVYHVLHGEQTVMLDQAGIDAAIESGQLGADGTYNGVVSAYQGQVLEPGAYTVPVDGRYWTGFNRMDLLDGPARSQAWSGTAHALVGELGVGAVTHSTLQLSLGVVFLLLGLGAICTVMGAAFVWHVRREDGKQIPDTVPEAFLTETIEGKESATA
ncbi:MAG: hypothetical protein QNJ12_02870 [Ilumatobacter sp.]|uniref:hypothetical protein n=1 Tax=Ilumatobacter sp. TaxID=1967498 RepID=UPI0026374C3B|nr:hypothetical protein [Ilumatobacter sp.]MDJ0767701.1 hypothetical protein [Ilumatobacter sp.]